MTTNRYAPEEHSATTALAAYVALGAEIVALQQEAQYQRERGDDMQRDASHLRYYVAELESAMQSAGLADVLLVASNAASKSVAKMECGL